MKACLISKLMYTLPILDAKYEKVDIEDLIKEHCSHLIKTQQDQLKGVLLQLDWMSKTSRQKNNLPTNQKGDDNSKTTVGRLLARRIQIYCVDFLSKQYFESYIEKLSK